MLVPHQKASVSAIDGGHPVKKLLEGQKTNKKEEPWPIGADPQEEKKKQKINLSIVTYLL